MPSAAGVNRPQKRLEQFGFLPVMSPYDELRVRWQKRVLYFLSLPVLCVMFWHYRKHKAESTSPMLDSLSPSDRYTTQLAYSQVMRNNQTSLNVKIYNNGALFHLEVPVEELLEKGYRKSVEDHLAVAEAKKSAEANK